MISYETILATEVDSYLKTTSSSPLLDHDDDRPVPGKLGYGVGLVDHSVGSLLTLLLLLVWPSASPPSVRAHETDL